MKVFVAGLSRSGKTSRSRHAAANLPDLEYVSVSELLRMAGGVFPVRTITDGLLNQRRAADALQSAHATRPHQLIDGHALIETDEGPLLVPDWFFDAVAPDLIIYICDRPDQILLRRPQIECHNNAMEIAALSAIERAACERISARMKIPTIVLREISVESFIDELRRYLENA